jgi:hypothetical protein
VGGAAKTRRRRGGSGARRIGNSRRRDGASVHHTKSLPLDLIRIERESDVVPPYGSPPFGQRIIFPSTKNLLWRNKDLLPSCRSGTRAFCRTMGVPRDRQNILLGFPERKKKVNILRSNVAQRSTMGKPKQSPSLNHFFLIRFCRKSRGVKIPRISRPSSFVGGWRT